MTICRSLLLSIPFVLVLGLASPAKEPKPKEAAAKPDSTAKARPKITISKETTCITEPLRADGYVDYHAAINRRVFRGCGAREQCGGRGCSSGRLFLVGTYLCGLGSCDCGIAHHAGLPVLPSRPTLSCGIGRHDFSTPADWHSSTNSIL